jgi:nicotinamide riboside transporter PnuC
MILACEYVGTVVGLISALALSFKNPLGMWGFMLTDALMSVVAAHNHLYGLVTLYVAYFCISIVGLKQWRKRESA